MKVRISCQWKCKPPLGLQVRAVPPHCFLSLFIGWWWKQQACHRLTSSTLLRRKVKRTHMGGIVLEKKKKKKHTGSTSLSLCTTKMTHNTSLALWGRIKQCMPPIDLCQQTLGTVETLMGLWCTTHSSRVAESVWQWVIFFSFLLAFLSSPDWRVSFEKLRSQETNLSQQLVSSVKSSDLKYLIGQSLHYLLFFICFN